MMWDESMIGVIEMAAGDPPVHHWGFAPTFICHPSLGRDKAYRPSAAQVLPPPMV